jgi:hypothetical protein
VTGAEKRRWKDNECATHTAGEHRRSNAPPAFVYRTRQIAWHAELLMMTVDENVSETVKLAVIRDALDRGGVGAKTEVDVSISAKPFEKIIDNLESGSRAEFRRNMGIEVSERNPANSPGGCPACRRRPDRGR